MQRVFFTVVAVAMIYLLFAAFTHSDPIGPADLMESAWGRLTVVDAYFAILTVYFLTAFREPSRWAKVLWLLLYVSLGSLAIALYMIFRFPAVSEGRRVP